jgi:Flp pilus assembly protein TadG
VSPGEAGHLGGVPLHLIPPTQANAGITSKESSMTRSFSRRAHSERGAVAVEFGIFAPILIALVAGLVYFGWGFNIKMTLTNAAREAVREYALGTDADPAAVARDYAATAVGAGNVVNVAVEATGCPNPGTNPGGQATVTVTYPFAPDVNFIPAVTIGGKAVMRCGG